MIIRLHTLWERIAMRWQALRARWPDESRRIRGVKFDTETVWLLHGDGTIAYQFRWPDVARFGYRTTEPNLWDDHWIEFHLKDGSRVGVSLDWTGGLALSAYAKKLPGVTMGELGSLANCVVSKSVAVWPRDDAGKSLDSFDV